MNGTRHGSLHNVPGERLATLVRFVPVRLVEVSRGGCRLECSSRLESGTSGMLAVELGGRIRVDDIRVARCQPRVGAGAMFQVGAELLGTRRLGRRTVRMALRSIIAGATCTSHARQDNEMPSPVEVRSDEVAGKSDGRAPPASPDRGS